MAHELTIYSVVILTSTGGVISRAADCLMDAVATAHSRRQDFPDAKEVRVVSSAKGVLLSI